MSRILTDPAVPRPTTTAPNMLQQGNDQGQNQDGGSEAVHAGPLTPPHPAHFEGGLNIYVGGAQLWGAALSTHKPGEEPSWSEDWI